MKYFQYVLITMIIMNTVIAQVDRTKIPDAAANPNFSFPVNQKADFPNGLKIMLVQKKDLPIVQMQFVFQTGAGHDPEELSGRANLTLRLLDSGTKTRNLMQIADEFNFLGAQFNASTSYDASFISVLSLKKHLDKVFPVLSDILQNSVYPENEFERIKNEILTAILQQKDRPEAIAGKVFGKIVFGTTHPYGRPIEGDESVLKNFFREDLVKFHDLYIRPNNATLIVVGDISLSELRKYFDKYFRNWEKKETGMVNIPKPEFANNNGIFMADKPNAPQSQIRIGMVGVPRGTTDYFAIEVMNMILGGNFNSRINWNLREQKGYTYGARSGFTYRKYGGSFGAGGGFKSSVTDSSVYELLAEIKRMRNENVTSEELIFAKNGLIRGLPRSFETSGQIASQLTNLVLYDLPDDYFNNYVQNIESITIEDIRRVSEKYLDTDRMSVVIVGDVDMNKKNIIDLNKRTFHLVDSDGNLLAE